MPFLKVEVAGPLVPATKRELLARTAELFAEIVSSPIERLRTQVAELPADSYAVGGVPIAESGRQSPIIWIQLLEGRPPEVHRALIERQTALIASILDMPVDDVRVRITEIPPLHWGIAGRPAADARADEIATRAATAAAAGG